MGLVGNATSSQDVYYLLEVFEGVIIVCASKETGNLESYDTYLIPTVKYLRGQTGSCLSVWQPCVPSSEHQLA